MPHSTRFATALSVLVLGTTLLAGVPLIAANGQGNGNGNGNFGSFNGNGNTGNGNGNCNVGNGNGNGYATDGNGNGAAGKGDRVAPPRPCTSSIPDLGRGMGDLRKLLDGCSLATGRCDNTSMRWLRPLLRSPATPNPTPRMA